MAMPKIKTNRSAAKRFRKTGTGKYKFSKANASHILTKKNPETETVAATVPDRRQHQYERDPASASKRVNICILRRWIMRIKRGFKARRRRNKVLKLAKGFRGGHSKLFRTAADTVDRALMFAFRDRKARKRDFRKLWITRINAGARLNDMTYSKLIHGLKLAGIEIDRKILAELVISDPGVFAQLAAKATVQ